MRDGNKTSDQSVLRSFEEALPITMLRTREALMARFRPMLAEHRVTEQQWRVIRAVREGGLDATALAERCCILMPSLSRMLKKLEKDGLLDRNKVVGDARRQVITLTAKGHALFDGIAPKSEAIYTAIEAEHGADKIQNLVDAMRALQVSLKD